jgi:hypothetical protein
LGSLIRAFAAAAYRRLDAKDVEPELALAANLACCDDLELHFDRAELEPHLLGGRFLASRQDFGPQRANCVAKWYCIHVSTLLLEYARTMSAP